MNFNKIALVSSLVVSGIAVSSGFSSAKALTNLISDPSFETPTTTNGGRPDFGGGQPIGSWTVLGNDVLLLNTNYTEGGPVAFNAEDGLNSVDLTGNGNTGPTDGVQQTVSTILNTPYTLTFWVGRANGNNSNYPTSIPSTVDLSVNGGSRISFTNSNITPNGINWEQFSYNFTATTSSTTIAFLNGTAVSNNLAGLDNVSLTGGTTAVPEPLNILGAVTGLALFGSVSSALKRRKLNK